MIKPIIKLKDLSVAYNLGKTNEAWVLSDITANIYPGEYVVFFGSSGCGKSTLLYTIAGLEFPTKGDVIVNGKNLHELKEEDLISFHRTTTGMIFQSFYLIPSLSVKDNILLPQIFSGDHKEERAKELMERFGIASLADRKPFLLSGGQQQRVAIARALVSDPPIILADEPVGNLDSKNADIVLQMLLDLNRKDKKTIIHVTHDTNALKRADKVFYMKDGRIMRTTLNPDRTNLEKRKDMSELEKLAQAYPYLTETSLRAKLILHHLLIPIGIEAQHRIEEVIDEYLLHKITKEAFVDKLRKAEEKGGAGLYPQRAEGLTEKVIKIASEIEIIEDEVSTLTPSTERAVALRGYLLDSYKGHLSFEQTKRLENSIQKRVEGAIKKQELQRLLDIPIKQGGVGLNKRTAKRFTREIELILMK